LGHSPTYLFKLLHGKYNEFSPYKRVKLIDGRYYLYSHCLSSGAGGFDYSDDYTSIPNLKKVLSYDSEANGWVCVNDNIYYRFLYG